MKNVIQKPKKPPAGQARKARAARSKRETDEPALKFRRLFESAPDGILIADAKTGVIEEANPRLLAMLGYALDEIVGKKVWQLHTDAKSAKRAYEELQVKKHIRYGNLPMAGKDGRAAAVECVSNIYQVGKRQVVQCHVHDTTERLQMEEVVKESEQRFRTLIEHSQDAIALIDARSRLIYESPAGLRITGYSIEERIGRSGFDLIHPDDIENIQRLFGQMAGKPRATVGARFRSRRKDGEWRWLDATAVNLLDDHAVGAIIVNYRDITEKKQADLKIQRQHAELAHVSRVSIMGELSASMAHELNQPLTAILTNAQAAQRFIAGGQADVNEFREILKDIVYDTTRARDVIRHLRALVKRSEPAFTRLDAGDTIREVVGFLHGDIVARNVHVSLELTPDLPAIHGDRIQMQQILINLLLNAFDALNGNPVADRLVTVVTMMESPQFIRVTVRDRGVGIPPHKIDSIFEPFFTTKPEGMGMGLSVTRSIVEAHGGRIWAENNVEGGAAFHFTLPVDESA